MSEITSSTRKTSSRASSTPSANLLWDRQNCVPLDRCLSKDDIILLLTPLVVPPESQVDKTSDPFEPLGRSLSTRHPAVRHVPYTKQDGITGVHIAFIKKADVVIFVLTGYSDDDRTQADLADLVNEACDSRPLIVVACCDLDEQDIQQHDFPTIVQATGFSAIDMGLVSSVLLNGKSESATPGPAPAPVTAPAPAPTPMAISPPSTPTPGPAPAPSTSQAPVVLASRPAWSVKRWSPGDVPEMHHLWLENVPSKFHLDREHFASLINRPDYAVHHVVREPSMNQMVGYCAAYANISDSRGEELIGSLAIMVVRQEFRGMGIGRLLHDTTISSLSRIRGVRRIQLGSTFPRFLYGIPSGHPDIKWLEGKGWPFATGHKAGAGRLIADWLIRFEGDSSVNLASAGLTFKPCELTDVPSVLDMVGRETERKHCFGWFDQYLRILDHSNIRDVLLGFEGTTLVASAITYIPNAGNPTALDLPWADVIGGGGGQVGGITCVCIKDDGAEVVNRRETIKVRLITACCAFLQSKGMLGALADGLKAEESGIEAIGFKKWAEYHEVWKHI
ncbi:unnamed protein product [Clonostachys rosea]|uniref:N-acetyltransferase domain-containing protein n=1 Tax=Bionectria ochroleuca TaxID=29856 RepID=A0ABY6TSB7_BIOOC|nr:unnamed protein product [Clonostachys rosea]